MVMSQTPLRMSFFGGGTDFKDYYKEYGGFVISACIDKYIYIIINDRNDDNIVLNYSEKEVVCKIEQIKHNIIREALKMVGIRNGIEITSISDITAQGSGLGSSSAFTVGLLNALYRYKGVTMSPDQLAKLACEIEIGILGNPIGKQDQYAVAFGGVKKYSFNKDDSVTVDDMLLDDNKLSDFSNVIMLFNTGITRKSSEILGEQKEQISVNAEHLHTIKDIAKSSEQYFMSLNYRKLGDLLNISWQNKRLLANRISNREIDNIFEAGKRVGVYGGKLLGAGGGGYFLFLCPPNKQEDLKKELGKYRIMPIRFTKFGTRIAYEN